MITVAVELQALHWLACLVICAEALNKLDRTAPCRPGLVMRHRMTESLKALAWSLLAIGAGGGLITPLMHLEAPTLQDVCVALGFAVLIVRTRIKEG